MGILWATHPLNTNASSPIRVCIERDDCHDESAHALATFAAYRDQGVDWSQRHEWKRRAEAYDAHLELKRRDLTEESAASAYKTDLAAYFERQKKLSAAIGLLTKASDGLKGLDTSRLKPLELAAIFHAAAVVAGAASDAEAVVLGVDDLLKDVANSVNGPSR